MYIPSERGTSRLAGYICNPSRIAKTHTLVYKMSRTTGKMSLSLRHKEQEKAKRIKKKRKRRRIDQFIKRDVDQLLLGELINREMFGK